MPPKKADSSSTTSPKKKRQAASTKKSTNGLNQRKLFSFELSNKDTTASLASSAVGGGKGGKPNMKPLTQFMRPLPADRATSQERTAGTSTTTPPTSSAPRTSGSSTPTTSASTLAPPFSLKGKEKAIAAHTSVTEDDQRLWLDMYEPQSEGDLAVHKRKVEDVRRWLQEALYGGPSGKLKKYRRILALTGPAGTGKTATLKVLANELNFDLVEWSNTVDDKYGEYEDYDSLSTKFRNFLDKASSYRALSLTQLTLPSTSNTTRQPTHNAAEATSNARKRPQLILIEDLPNILHPATKEAFHDALNAFATSEEPPSCPLVLIVSDSGVRGEGGGDDDSGGRSFGKGDSAVDVRGVVPKTIMNSPYFTQIGFNPIAVTLLRKALNTILDKHFPTSTAASLVKPSKEALDMIIESCNGDIRSALMGLQFACIIDLPPSKGKGRKKGMKNGSHLSGKGNGKSVKGVLEAVTRREQSLALFHLLGKLLYNKRYGDPEDEEDGPTYKMLKLPLHLKEDHKRRVSKVNVNVLYADSPVDTSLLSLYLHQNYTQYCNDVDNCDGVMEWMSLADTMGRYSGDGSMGSALGTAHGFHLLTLGMLHSLPSPVVRRGQTNHKPEWFEVLKRTRDAEDALLTTQQHLGVDSGWSKETIVCELGGVLRGLSQGRWGDSSLPPPPETHHLFSRLVFEGKHGNGGGGGMLEDDGGAEAEDVEDDDERLMSRQRHEAKKPENNPGWLEEDDIEDF